jgi:DNA repair protein RadC
MQIPTVKITATVEGRNPNARLGNPMEIYESLKANWPEGSIDYYECFYVLMLSRNLTINGLYKVSEGGSSSTVVDISKIMVAMLQTLSCNMVLVHNHPSGNLKASSQDIDLTKKIKGCSALFGYTVCDHLIITSEGFYSFANEGLL